MVLLGVHPQKHPRLPLERTFVREVQENCTCRVWTKWPGSPLPSHPSPVHRDRSLETQAWCEFHLQEMMSAFQAFWRCGAGMQRRRVLINYQPHALDFKRQPKAQEADDAGKCWASSPVGWCGLLMRVITAQRQLYLWCLKRLSPDNLTGI